MPAESCQQFSVYTYIRVLPRSAHVHLHFCMGTSSPVCLISSLMSSLAQSSFIKDLWQTCFTPGLFA